MGTDGRVYCAAAAGRAVRYASACPGRHRNGIRTGSLWIPVRTAVSDLSENDGIHLRYAIALDVLRTHCMGRRTVSHFRCCADAIHLSMFLAGAITNAIPGIILHLILVPLIVIAMERAKLIPEE